IKMLKDSYTFPQYAGANDPDTYGRVNLPDSAKGHRATVHNAAKTFGDSSPEEVLAHAERQQARGKKPSRAYKGIKNPREALRQAQEDIERDTVSEELLQKYLEVDGDIEEAKRNLVEYLTANGYKIYIDWTGGTNQTPRMGGYVVPKDLVINGHGARFDIYDGHFPVITIAKSDGTDGMFGTVLDPATMGENYSLEHTYNR
ncbi:MAG: hypothetical protein QG562_659, partial [Patescibacteria group bacterium]|nr:hypothetical protein [Patescibacteria group bacterium]